MKRVMTLLVCTFVASTSFATDKINTEKVRNQGNWEVHCHVAYPQTETDLEKTIGRLRTQCEIAALRLSVKQHARDGKAFKAQLSKEKIDPEKSKITVVARLVTQ